MVVLRAEVHVERNCQSRISEGDAYQDPVERDASLVAEGSEDDGKHKGGRQQL